MKNKRHIPLIFGAVFLMALLLIVDAVTAILMVGFQTVAGILAQTHLAAIRARDTVMNYVDKRLMEDF